MAREKFHTLTEQMFYVLLCLDEECCGTDILDRVPSMTGGRVTVGSGTLYNLLEQLSHVHNKYPFQDHLKTLLHLHQE